jgi:peroxiredoxin
MRQSTTKETRMEVKPGTPGPDFTLANYDEFKKAGVEILQISADPLSSLKRFRGPVHHAHTRYPG